MGASQQTDALGQPLLSAYARRIAAGATYPFIARSVKVGNPPHWAIRVQRWKRPLADPKRTFPSGAQIDFRTSRPTVAGVADKSSAGFRTLCQSYLRSWPQLCRCVSPRTNAPWGTTHRVIL